MANFGKIIQQALKAAEMIAPIVGGPGGAAAVAAAEAIQGLLHELKGTGSPTDDANIQQQLDDLQTRVNRQTDTFVGLARGTSGGTGGAGGGNG
jgi:hypothetical protein